MQIHCIAYTYLIPNIKQFSILNSIFNKNKTVFKFTKKNIIINIKRINERIKNKEFTLNLLMF